MKSKRLIATLFALGLLVSCAHTDPQSTDMSSAIRNARTRADHSALAQYYENAAKRMQANSNMAKFHRRLAEDASE